MIFITIVVVKKVANFDLCCGHCEKWPVDEWPVARHIAINCKKNEEKKERMAVSLSFGFRR